MKPAGDQPQAIEALTHGLKEGKSHQVLLGVTGSGKTFTMAKVIENYGRPTLVISHNKTLAAQLYREFKEFFPKNAVHYFVSYFDYYQPEAYLPSTNTYIEKDSKINEEIDRMRHASTQALMSRNDVIIVASVSCIYNIGDPEDYKNLGLELFEKKKITPSELVRSLTRLQYTQDIELKRGCFRKTHDEIEIVSPSAQEIHKIKFSLKNGKTDRIESMSLASIAEIDDLENGNYTFNKIVDTVIYPAKYWIANDSKIALAVENIKSELQKHMRVLKKQNKLTEAGRLYERTLRDVEMIKQTGYCHGIENYSMHLDFRKPGAPPYSLLDFFKSKGEFLTIIDESHISIPQLGGMYAGDHSRKSTLVEYGWRLPSAIDNRPLKFKEFNQRVQKIVYASATPGEYELKKAGKQGVTEQVVRPTGLLDPTIEIHPTDGQIPHLLEQIKERAGKKERVIVTTLTKRMAEDLAEHLAEKNIKVNYLHSEIKTLERVKILKDFRLGRYDVLIGVNLLREGLDLPEVSLVAILDADKEGFLRNTTTMIQTMGRAARHINGHVILYADKDTKSIKASISETGRRRKKQEEHNKKHGITPESIMKSVSSFEMSSSTKKSADQNHFESGDNIDIPLVVGPDKAYKLINQLTKIMEKSIRKMDYERALALREQIQRLKQMK